MSEQKKLRVAIFMGGDSAERETSLDTGRNVYYKLSTDKYEKIPLFVDDNMHLYRIDDKLIVKNSTSDLKRELTPDLQVKWSELPTICDFGFIGLHGGRGENGAVQGALETLGIPYNGPGVFASALCMLKDKTNDFLAAHGFDVSRHTTISKKVWATRPDPKELLDKAKLTLPVIVKPTNDGCSVLVSKATTPAELATQLDHFFSKRETDAMVEEFIVGEELTCGVIGNENPHAFVPSRCVAVKGILSLEEKFLPGAGENQTPAPLSPSAMKMVREIVAQAYTTVGCQGYSRIDCFFQDATISPTKKDRLIFLEFNTLPALTPATCLFHQAAEDNIRPQQLLDMIVNFGLAAAKTATAHQSATLTPALKDRVDGNTATKAPQINTAQK